VDSQQVILFQNLKRIKDYWEDNVTNTLTPGADLKWSSVEDDFNLLQKALGTPQLQRAFSNVLNDTITGVMHSIMVMVDGGDALADEMQIDLVNVDKNVSIKGNTALHEGFYEYLLEVEDLK